MSDLMEKGILTMPYEQAMSDELSRMQFWSRAQLAYKELERLRAQMAGLKLIGYSCDEGGCGRIHDESDGDYMDAVYVIAKKNDQEVK